MLSKDDFLMHSTRLDIDVNQLSEDDLDYYWNFWVPKDKLSEYLDKLMRCLTDDERYIIDLIVFDKYSFRKAKEQLEVDHASIFRRYKRILRKLYIEAIKLI